MRLISSDSFMKKEYKESQDSVFFLLMIFTPTVHIIYDVKNLYGLFLNFSSSGLRSALSVFFFTLVCIFALYKYYRTKKGCFVTLYLFTFHLRTLTLIVRDYFVVIELSSFPTEEARI
jgi:hypothetical protein